MILAVTPAGAFSSAAESSRRYQRQRHEKYWRFASFACLKGTIALMACHTALEALMYAVIKTGGKQYNVRPGDVIVVEKLEGDVGADVTFGQVLMLGGDKGVSIGAPLVEGASVAATLIETRKGEKIKIFKKIRRQGYRRTNGHRQMETVLRITGVEGAGEKAKWDGATSLMTKADMDLRARGLAPR